MRPRLGSPDDCGETTPIIGRRESFCSHNGEPHIVRGWFPVRYWFAFQSNLGILLVYAMRVNLSVAMVAMVRQPLASPVDDLESSVACPSLLPDSHIYNSTIHVTHNQVIGEFDWPMRTQSNILGSFFYGYVITQIPGGIIAQRRVAKWLFVGGVLVTSVFTLLTPIAARYHVYALIAVRVIEGLAEGVTYPAMNALIGRWVPKLERSRIATIIFSGSPIGTILALTITGILCESTFMGGWPSVFYIFGVIGCAWSVLWILTIYESPDDHPRISKEELMYIKMGQDERDINVPTPWKAILSSKAVWALVITHLGQNWGFYTFLTELPTYLANILHVDIKKNGLLSSLPYVSNLICANIASVLADTLRKTGHFRITKIRKLMNSVALFLPAICLLLIIFAECNSGAIISLLVLSLGFNGFMYSGFNVTHVDMSPMFAGTLMGLTNCIANFAGFLAPAFVGKMVEDGQTLENWNMIFIATATFMVFSGFIYNYFGSAELQPWGTIDSEPRRCSYSEKRQDSSETTPALTYKDSNF